jgi:hypothetical protein
VILPFSNHVDIPWSTLDSGTVLTDFVDSFGQKGLVYLRAQMIETNVIEEKECVVL